MDNWKSVEPPDNLSAPRSSSPGCLGPGLTILLWWLISVTLLIRLGYEILDSGINPDAPVSRSTVFPLVAGLVVLVICLVPALLWKGQPYRSIFRSWALAAVYILLLIPARLTPTTTLQSQAVLHILLSLVFLIVVWRSRKLFTPTPGRLLNLQPPLRFDWRSPFSLLVVGALSWPWLAWGALGSWLDTILQIGAGLAFGAAATVLIETSLILPALVEEKQKPLNFFLGGVAVATTLWLMASGLGFHFGVMQVLIIACLTPLAWLWLALRLMVDDQTVSWPEFAFPSLLIGLATALPAALFDANELALIIGLSAGEALGWAVRAALLSTLIGVVIAILGAIWLFRTKPAHLFARIRVTGIGAIVAWLVGALIYFSIGQPGMHGENMFVILNEHADLRSAASIDDYTQRRQFVYEYLLANANSSQALLRQSLERWHIPYTPYYLVNAIEVPNNPLLRWQLTRRSEVERILDSPQLRPLARPQPQETGDELDIQQPDWNLTMIGADRVWNELGVTGKGVVVGQSDSGAQWDHPELRDSYRGRDGYHTYNWLDPWENSPAPVDSVGHGTHTLGTVVGNHTGVAPEATWIACANLKRNLGNPTFYLDCLQFMLAPHPAGGDPFSEGRPELGAMVLNNSWGCPDLEGCDPDALRDAVIALRAAGVFVVSSAGNDGPNCSTITDPIALYPEVVTVGAVDEFGNQVNFSSLGPVTADGSGRIKPDLVAPGVQVLSAFPGNTYKRIDGTSMAGPHVAGVVALMWSANPDLVGDIDRTEQILQDTAAPYQGMLPDCPGASDRPSTAVGYGLVDAYQAVKSALK
jgi:hypothetical protein